MNDNKACEKVQEQVASAPRDLIYEVEGGRYGYYGCIDEDGNPMKYYFARRDTDFGHRHFATLEECRYYAETGMDKERV